MAPIRIHLMNVFPTHEPTHHVTLDPVRLISKTAPTAFCERRNEIMGKVAV